MKHNLLRVLCKDICKYYRPVSSPIWQSLFNPLPDDEILDWSKLKQIAVDILKCI